MTATSTSYHYQEIILDSADRKFGTSNIPDFQFDQNIDQSQYFQLHRVIVPTTYYVFDEFSNGMRVNGTLINWPVGNYTPAEWIAATAPLPSGIVATYDASRNKLLFTRGATFTIVFQRNQPNHNGNLELGFQQDITYTSAVSGFNEVIESEFAVNFSGPNFVYLRSNMAGVFNNSEMYFSNTTVTNTGGDILAMVPINQNRNSVVNYIDHSNHMFQWKTEGNKRFSMYFTLGRRTTVLDFNGQPFQVRFHGYSIKESGPRYNH